ncbi:ABC transporter ATP-binding protein [Pelagibacterium luteolum]|uniref:NitT/TauT family transport system ATP-binding protein n=1 Tax=Pelagibacterium luteolum TaxID=440168 RepID=A0A1G7RVT3_9HYPH|nr:ABC transporter ATP-binding protein [Pelagibacterium luteolum]SDG14848.1 NitT/TauT family transport system ATP-binding protein [Pelagibacterium luteolum]
MKIATAEFIQNGAQPVTGANKIIEVKNVSKVYGTEVVALKDINLDFEAGQLTSLLGPSGCGKTTLLKIIAGLLPATQGDILVNGKKVTAPGPERAFVFQDFALLPWATVLDNAAFGLKMQGKPKAERDDIANHYVKEVGLDGFQKSYPHQLSGGMRQRVGLARALSVNADVLLMDEPFSAVDEQTRRKFQEDLIRLREVEKKTFIFVTHSIEEAVYVSDRIILLSPRPGRVSEIIDPDIPSDIGPDELRRNEVYLETVENIWHGIKKYVD